MTNEWLKLLSLHIAYELAKMFWCRRLICLILSKALTAPQAGGEHEKKINFEFDPLASSTMYVNTLSPRIMIITSFVWLQLRK